MVNPGTMSKKKANNFIKWLVDEGVLCNHSFEDGFCRHCYMPQRMRLITGSNSDPFNRIGLFSMDLEERK